MLNVKEIIDETVKVFSNNKDKFEKLPVLDYEKYYSLHSSPLVPLNIKIDCLQFLKDIEQFKENFQIWGTKNIDQKRFGLSLVNMNGIIYSEKQDPINGSLYEWNNLNPDFPLIESDFLIPTPALNIPSLDPLRIFDGKWSRSNILKWKKDAAFKPHIDAIIPTPWIRLWGTTNADNIKLNFYNDNNQLIEIPSIESGRIYLIDTVLVHEAKCTGEDINYQFFLSVLPDAYDLLLKLKKIR